MMPLARILDRAATLHGRQPSVVDGDVRLSYDEVARRVARLAGSLRARGIMPGDRVAMLGRNSFRYFEINLACAHAGIVLVPLNIRLAPPEIARILAMTQAKLLFQSLPFAAGSVPTLAFDDSEPSGADTEYERLIAAAPALERAAERKGDDIAQ